MKIVYDTEFVDDGKTIELLSLGMVAENGDELYRVFVDGPWTVAANTTWLRENVLIHLPVTVFKANSDQYWAWEWNHEHPDGHPDPEDPHPARAIATRERIAMDVERFLVDHGSAGDVQLWADYPATDHVALYQLWGPMIECTQHGMPMRTSCLKQEEESIVRLIPRGEPNATRAQGLIKKFLSEKPVQNKATEHHALHDARHDMALLRWLRI